MKGTINESFDAETQSESIGIRLSALNTDDIPVTVSHTADENGKTTLQSIDDEALSAKKPSKYSGLLRIGFFAGIHIAVGVFFGFATCFYIAVMRERWKFEYPDTDRCNAECGMQFCNGYGMLVLIVGFVYLGLFYYYVLKPKFGQKIYQKTLRPFGKWWKKFSRTRVASLVIVGVVLAALAVYASKRKRPKCVLR